jgi:hypothetical protein
MEIQNVRLAVTISSWAHKVPYIPAAKIYFKQFKWELFDATALKGKTYSLEFAQIFDSGLGVGAWTTKFRWFRDR